MYVGDVEWKNNIKTQNAIFRFCNAFCTAPPMGFWLPPQ